MTSSNNTLCCHWCGVSLSGASRITMLNGNLPVCDLCLIRGNRNRKGYELASPYDLESMKRYMKGGERC